MDKWDELHLRPIIPPKPDFSSVSDTTLERWAFSLVSGPEACFRGANWHLEASVAEDWNTLEETIIVVAEAWAAVQGVERFEELQGKPFSVRTDNTVALYALRKGGSRVADLVDAAWQLTEFLVEHRSCLTGVHWIPTMLNGYVDKLLRESDKETRIAETAWKAFIARTTRAGLQTLTVDAFASERCDVVPRYVSRFRDLKAEQVDFFLAKLSPQDVLWVFSPDTMVAEAMEHMQAHGLRGFIASRSGKDWHAMRNRALWTWEPPYMLRSAVTSPDGQRMAQEHCLRVFAWRMGSSQVY